MVYDKIAEILSRYFDLDKDEIEEETNIFEDLAAGDYDMARILNQVEEEFNLDEDIPEEEYEELAEVRNLVSYVSEQIGEEI